MKSRFQTFVAVRYLMAHPMHLSWLAIGMGCAGIWEYILQILFITLFLTPPDPRSLVDNGTANYGDYVMAANITLAAAVFWFYVAAVRAFFTFYSTVSIVGVSIGAAALVLVLSIMNGFESDLRHKILGSNAHIQITKEDGEFTEWAELRTRIDKVAGVKASTPFATSEVVIAANSNYFNVVVKGIDVKSAVEVTDLKRILRTQDDQPDPEALERLEPLVKDESEAPLVTPETAPTGPVIDPAPDDLPGAGDAIDYSVPGEPAGAGLGRARIGTDPLGAPDLEPPDFGGFDGPVDSPVVDQAPDDFADSEPVLPSGPPADYTERAPPIVREPHLGEPGGKRRTSRVATLNGVLAGKELFKQIHLYVDQEVRLVSPLADPMNPDANGTPIPFNRDYRVGGMFYTGMYEYDLKLVYVSLESLQEFLRMGDAIDGIEVRIKDPDDVDEVVASIQKQLGPAYRVQGWRELNRNLFSALKLEKIAMFLVLAIIILVASFSIVGTLIVTVVEKGKEIALLKTLGASDGGIVGVFVIQGLSIGLIGITLGVANGLAGAWALSVFGFPLNPDVYYIDRLPIEIDPLMVALVFSAGIVISVAATIYPAILAAQLRPAHGLKM